MLGQKIQSERCGHVSKGYRWNYIATAALSVGMEVFRFDLHCPDIASQSDAIEIRETLANSPGISYVDVDVQGREVHVVTANQDAGRDVLRMLVKAGFPPQELFE